MTTRPIIAPKKLIEVALPLDAINKAAAYEKSIRVGHPSTLHLWWARRPLAAARAVLFAQLVNDPSWKFSEEELKKPQVKAAVTRKRNELFKLIAELVKWENTKNEQVLSKSRALIRESWREVCEANKDHTSPDVRKIFDPNNLPPLHDPFAGGGSIPLEAQRLGLTAHASDLNPIAVLINKATIEIPQKFTDQLPVARLPPHEKQAKAKATEDWSGVKGLAEDVRRYGIWMREQALARVGHLYPKAKITKALIRERPDLKKYEGRELTVIAWLWARTVVSPNPAAQGAFVPLVRSFRLASKKGREAWIEPLVDQKKCSIGFRVRRGDFRPKHEGTVGRQGAVCLLTGSPISFDHIREKGQAGQLGAQLMAVVAEGERERVYLDSSAVTVPAVAPTGLASVLGTELPERALGFRVQAYGMRQHEALFSARQLLVLSVLTELVETVKNRVVADALAAGRPEGSPLEEGGSGARAYGDAIAVYMALAVNKLANYSSSICTWHSGEKYETITSTFGRHALPMTWDFAEGNPFGNSSGNFLSQIDSICANLQMLPVGASAGIAQERDAASETPRDIHFVSTDPPYFDNIGYADLSDFFYIWTRRSLGRIMPRLCSMVLTPKSAELIATPFRHRNMDEAEKFFLAGMTKALRGIMEYSREVAPFSLYYAFKQSEEEADDDEKGVSSTGWEVFLQAIVDAGAQITGTWPMRTEYTGNLKKNSNALASSVVLVCRPRVTLEEEVIGRRQFLRELEANLAPALDVMLGGADSFSSIAPVDLAQAAIGPGMAIFSRYKTVLEADGSPMTVHNALIHINKAIDNYFAHAEGELDPDTRFCIGWFQQHGFEAGPFGEADVLARAKGTSVNGVKQSGVLDAGKGRVRLFKVKEYPEDWDPTKDARPSIWEACHQMSRALIGSEHEAGKLLARMPEKQDAIRQLAYRLYTLCERKRWAEEARAYNELITSWSAIVEESLKVGHKGEQIELL